MMKKSIYIAGALIVSISSAAVARINFGSENAGISVVDGTMLAFDFSSATSLNNGLLRDRSGNAILATNGLACSNMTLDIIGEGDVEPHEVTINGTVVPGGSITLGDDEKLTVRGGRVVESVVVAGAPDHASIIEGEGEFYNSLSMENNSELIIRWNGQLNRNITMTATNARDGSTPADTCYVRLHQDLEFAPGYFFVPSGSGDCSVNCVSNDTQYKLIMGGIPGESLEINHNFNVVNSYIRLTGPVVINNVKSLNIHGGFVEGGGNEIQFLTIYSFFNNTNESITLDNVLFSGTTPLSFQGNGAWQFLNCRIMSNAYSWYAEEGVNLDLTAESFDFTGKLVSGYNDLFAGTALFVATNSGSLELSLHTDIEVYGAWRFNNQATIKGNGKTITFHTVEQEVDEGIFEEVKQGLFGLGSVDSIYFENVTLANMKGVVFDTSTGGNKIDLCNVKWLDSNGNNIFITGLNDNAAELQLVPASSEVAGDIFDTNVTWANSACIELLGDITLSATWTCYDDVVIDGRGATFDVTDAVLTIATGKTLTLRNMKLDGAKTALFSFTEGYEGSISLSNVTIVLAASAEWTNAIHATGPLTVITGAYSLSGNNLVIDDGTAYYDTLGSADTNNFTVDVGRVMHIHHAGTQGTITVNGNKWLDKNEYLFPDMEGPEGRIITCTGSGVLNGLGRTMVCPQTHGFSAGDGVVITVAAEQKLVTTNMIVDRLVPAEHIAGDGSIYFGHDTIVRLNQDIQLSDVLRFGSNEDAIVDEYMELDLGGHTIDLGESSGIQLYGATDGENMLVIKNGRIIINGSNQIGVNTAGHELVFENVELVLNGCNWEHATGFLTVKGNCKVSGTTGSALIMSSDESIEIRALSTLTLCDGIVYSHMSDANLIFAAGTSTLELVGATVRHPDYRDIEIENTLLTLSTGKIVADHKSYFQPGAAGITLDDSLTIELRPGATIIVGTHGTEDLQDTSPGTLTYGATEGGA